MVDETSKLNVEVDGTRAARDVDKITAAFKRLESAVSRAGSNFKRLGAATASTFSKMRSAGAKAFSVLGAGFRGIQKLAGTFARAFRLAFKVIAIGIGVFTIFARSVADAGNKINKFINTLVILKGNTAGAVSELNELFKISNRLGTSFEAAATPFTKFAAAAAGTISDKSIRDVFESFATVGVALQLTKSEVTGVFLALQQIASKGVVSMEELRLQLAERVPGAMRLAAISMGMSMREFEIAVRDRTINAGEFLEKFAVKLKETFGLAAELASTRLFADIQRLGNEFIRFRQEIFQSGFEEGLKELVRAASSFLRNNPELAKALGGFSKEVFSTVSNFLNSLSSDKIIGILNGLIGAFETLINVISTLAFHVRRLFDDDFDEAIGKIEEGTTKLDALIRQRNRLADIVATGQIRAGFGPTDADVPFETASEAQIENAKGQLGELENDIIDLRGELQGTIGDVRALGVEIAFLPDTLFGNLPQGGPEIGPPQITIPRIEPVGVSEGLPLANQPAIEGLPAATADALEQAERLATIQLPEFYEKVINNEIRDGLTDIVRVSLDLANVTESQVLLMEKIKAAEAELAVLRSVTDEEADAVKLNNANMRIIEDTEKFISEEERRLELQKELIKLKDDELRQLEKLKTFQQELEETFTSVRDVVINSIKKTEDAFAEMVASGKADFKELAESIIKDLVRLAIQAFLTRFILGPLLGGITQSFGDQLGGTFSTPSPAVTGVGLAHTGGIIGEDRLQQRSSFDNLRSNEQPIIVQRGEGIFTQQQMASLASVSTISGALSRVSSPQIINSSPTVNIDTPPVDEINSTAFNNVNRELDPITDKSTVQEEGKRELINEQLKLVDEERNNIESFKRTFTSIQDIFTNSIKKTGGVLSEFVTTGKVNSKNLIESITSMADESRLQQKSSFDNLRDNDQPIRARRDEDMFAQQQTEFLASMSIVSSALAKVSSPPQMNNRPPIVNVNAPSTKVEIINNTGEETEVNRSKSANGNELIQLIIGTINTDIAADGNISRTLRGKFGLKTTTGLR